MPENEHNQWRELSIYSKHRRTSNNNEETWRELDTFLARRPKRILSATIYTAIMGIAMVFIVLFVPPLLRGTLITLNFSQFLNINYYIPDIVSMFLGRITGIDPRSITLWELFLYPIFYKSWNWSRLRLGVKLFGYSYSRVSQTKLMERLLTQLETLSPKGINTFWKAVDTHLKSDGSYNFKLARVSLREEYRNRKQEEASSSFVEYFISTSALRKLKRLDAEQRRVLLEIRGEIIKQIETS
ncbi:hypothetical protein ACFLV5_06320 [Chloroflexota bacterium]